MNKDDFTRTLVSAAVRKGIRDIENDSRRSARNLVDLGAFFAKTKRQKEFFKKVQKLLTDPNSAYYPLVEALVRRTDAQTMETVCVNVGYGSWTSGARKLRQVSQAQALCVPWALTFDLTGGADGIDVPALVAQANELGVFSFFLFLGEEGTVPDGLIQALKAFGTSAFFIFCSSAAPIEQAGVNMMFSFEATAPEFEAQWADALERRLFAGVHRLYTDEDVESIVSGRVTDEATALELPFVCLVASEQCSVQARKCVQEYVIASRYGQEYPLICFDFPDDVLYINRVISDGAPLLVYRGSDGAVTVSGQKEPLCKGGLPLKEVCALLYAYREGCHA
ncbi:MAG: hypothetical protein IJP30_04385 [Clostridia bacterium]|nr:hypothetical protein [Clostridia bacterium]